MKPGSKKWVSTAAFARMEGVAVVTILRATRAGALTFRRRGLGRIRSPMEFPLPIAHQQFQKWRGRDGIFVPGAAPAASPTLIEIAQLLRTIHVRLQRLEVLLRQHRPAR